MSQKLPIFSKRERPEESKFETKDFYKAVHMMIELLGRDMESANPSRDKSALIVVREGLFRVEVAGQLFGRIRAYRKLLLKFYPECAKVEFDVDQQIKVATKIAKLSIQSFAGKSPIFELMQDFGINTNDLQMSIFAFTQFIEMIRILPLKFFENLDIRLQIITAMQQELDELILTEENQELENFNQ